MNTMPIQEVSGIARSMQDSLKNNRNLRTPRVHIFDMNSSDDYDGSRPLKFKESKRNKSGLKELDLEMKKLRRKHTIIQVVAFSVAAVVTVALIKFLLF